MNILPKTLDDLRKILDRKESLEEDFYWQIQIAQRYCIPAAIYVRMPAEANILKIASTKDYADRHDHSFLSHTFQEAAVNHIVSLLILSKEPDRSHPSTHGNHDKYDWTWMGLHNHLKEAYSEPFDQEAALTTIVRNINCTPSSEQDQKEKLSSSICLLLLLSSAHAFRNA